MPLALLAHFEPSRCQEDTRPKSGSRATTIWPCRAWPTRGAAFIDAACLLIRAMAAGHDADQAEALAYFCPGWQQAPSVAIDIFALASARLYGEIARNDPQPFKRG